MYIINTSFHTGHSIANEIIGKIQSELIPSMRKSSLFSDITMAEILIAVDPNCYSFTLQSKTNDFEQAMEWLQAEAQKFYAELQKCYGENVVFFTTPMRMLK
ncbi:MAG: DUF4286 family protein [Muribaculaceae bacterium]|nr:DUF4286 family protein [Muribaculaceae bacterium]